MEIVCYTTNNNNYLQPFAQSATFKLLSLRFNLMITFNHHIKFSKMSTLREHLSGLKTLPAMLNKHSTGADVVPLDKKNSILAIPQENVLLCINLCPVCTHIQVAVISTFSHELAILNNKRFNTFE